MKRRSRTSRGKSRETADASHLDLRDSRLTESFNPRTARIDDASPLEIVRLLNAEDRTVPDAVAAQERPIAGVIAEVADRLSRGGRLFYVGAGTSGRLGVLDAAECPPTFGSDPDRVQGIVAGGAEALVRSLEGAEDEAEEGGAAIRRAGASVLDFVLGIAASGTTPYVHGALEAALEAGAGTGLLACTPPPEGMAGRVGHLITPLTGPETIAGSTRLKAGTATKLVLNMITTGVMIRLGKVYGNLMVDLRAVSRKLVDRSLRMLVAVTGLERAAARRLLIASGGSVKTAIAMHEMRVGRFTAERRLEACDGFLTRTIRRFPPGSPVRDFAEFPEHDSQGWERLVDRLTAAPEAVRRAVERSGAAADATVSRTGPDVVWQVDHLVRYEREAVRPRLEAWREANDLTFPSWDDETEPGPSRAGADVGALPEVFRRERKRTVAVLRATGPDILPRRGRIAEEVFLVHQFLRAVAQHDAAHVARIGERLHRSLLEETE